MIDVLMYGGGRQTVAYCVLITQGHVAQPDKIVIADTGREKQSTWDYMAEITQPLLASIGLEIEIAPRSYAYVDLYAKSGHLLLPVFTETGKFPAYCSDEWKKRVAHRYLREQGVAANYTSIIGFAYDERQRIKSRKG